MKKLCRSEICLNGWWDFLPVLTEAGKGHLPPGTIPDGGWQDERLLVPGSWTRGMYTPGRQPESPATEAAKPWIAWRMYDSYNNPPDWETTNTGWCRRRFTLPAIPRHRRCVIEIGAVLRESWIFLNGKPVGRSLNGLMPVACDVTDALRPGANELIVYCTDYRRDGKGKVFVPNGLDQTLVHNGIWQDVFLRTFPDCHIRDVTIRTRVRTNTLTILATLANDSPWRRTVTPSASVLRDGAEQLSLRAAAVALEPGETRTVVLSQAWSSYRPWSPRTPDLYDLETSLREGHECLDARRDRFGFREIWTEGPHVMLNGAPCHMSGDWCHKNTFDVFQPEYIRQWFRMIKDANMNYVRTHMFPHPPVMLDIADEMGILVCVESGFAFGGTMALDSGEFWTNCEQHVRDIVLRDKNHPSVILWSVGNETRWSGNVNAVIHHAPRLRALYEELDPTRITYHDGDSSLWDETTQPLLSRHYGIECAGEGWWDKRKPLHVGEIGRWHYAQPCDNGVFGDDQVYASFAECHRAAAREAAALCELGRANEVCCLFPWNLSGLDNYRPWPEERRFPIADPGAPGIKIPRTAPYTSEFAWWEPDAKGYAPGPSFEIMRHAFRPLAVLVREHLSRLFDDADILHTVTVVNDTGETVSGALQIRAEAGGRTVWSEETSHTIEHGRQIRRACVIPGIPVADVTDIQIVSTWTDAGGIRDEHRRALRISPAALRHAPWKFPRLAVFGSGPAAAVLEAHGVRPRHIGGLHELDIGRESVVLIERNAIAAGSTQNSDLRAFLEKGGRAVLLEQTACVFPALSVVYKPVERVHVCGGRQDILKDLAAGDFEFWGTDPFGVAHSNACVTEHPYVKPAAGHVRALLQSAHTDFRCEGLRYTPLFEHRVGSGMVLASQLNLSGRLDTHPVAHELLRRFLEYAFGYKPAPESAVEAHGEPCGAMLARVGAARDGKTDLVLAEGKGLSPATAAAYAARARAGATVVLTDLDVGSVAALASALGVNLEAVDLGRQYQLVRDACSPMLDGVGHDELSWLDKVSYSAGENRPMTDVLLRCPEAESWLASERDSCWREFFTLGASSEWLRMPVATHLLWNGPRASASGLLSLAHGAGRVILCQVPAFGEACLKADVFWTQFLSRLGARFGASLLDGDAVKVGSKRSDGFPAALSLIRLPDDALVRAILKASVTTEMRIANQAMTTGFDWVKTDTPEGVVSLSEPADRVVIEYQIHAGRLRKAVAVEGEWPDPARQTLLDLQGGGAVTLFVNGRQHPTLSLGDAGRGTVADIDLDQIYNTIVLIWKPAAGLTLKQSWRNREGLAETEFLFLP